MEPRHRFKDNAENYGFKKEDALIFKIGEFQSPYKDKSTYHTNPEEALSIARNLKSKKVLGMHWGTFRELVLSLD